MMYSLISSDVGLILILECLRVMDEGGPVRGSQTITSPINDDCININNISSNDAMIVLTSILYFT